MRFKPCLAVAALAVTFALPAVAQTPPAKTPPAATDAALPPSDTPPAPSAATATGADASATASTLAVGLTVKDNTGAAIGQITALKPDTSGKQVATIKMGAESFAVDAANLAVQDGSAVVNATQAELQGMIKKSTPPKK